MKFVIFTILLILPLYLTGQNNNNPLYYEIADFYHSKKGALTLTFDDGTLDQFSIGLKILDQFDFKGTFFIISGNVDWDILRQVAKNGHEIGSHTVNHLDLKEIPFDSVKVELKQSKATIEQMIDGYQCISLAYPFGRSNDSVRQIASRIYESARSTDMGYDSKDQSYFYQLKTYNLGTKTKLKEAKKWVNSAMLENNWLIETYHGFDGNSWQPLSSDFFTKHLQYIKSKEDYLWVAPFRDVVKYLKEKAKTAIQLEDSSYNFYRFSIKDNLPDSIYNFPLSLKFKIPKYWNNIKVLQNNIEIGYQMQSDICGNKYIIFDAVPDYGDIIINAENVGTDSTNCNHCEVAAFPNPFSQSLTILSNASDKGEFSIYDSKGSCMVKDKINSEIKILNTSDWKSGVYILSIKLAENSKFIIKKIVKE